MHVNLYNGHKNGWLGGELSHEVTEYCLGQTTDSVSMAWFW